MSKAQKTMLKFEINTYCDVTEAVAKVGENTIFIYQDEESTLLSLCNKEGEPIFAKEFSDVTDAREFAENDFCKVLDESDTFKSSDTKDKISKFTDELNCSLAKQVLQKKSKEIAEPQRNDLQKMVRAAFGKDFGDAERAKKRKELLKSLPKEVVNALIAELREILTDAIMQEHESYVLDSLKEELRDDAKDELRDELRPQIVEELTQEIHERIYEGTI